MNARIKTVLGPEHQRMSQFTRWAITDGVLQGVAVATVVPLIDALVHRDSSRFWTWALTLFVLTVAAMVAHYVQAMKSFAVSTTILANLQRQLGDHVVSLPLGWFDSSRAGSISVLATKGVMSLSNAGAHMISPVMVGISSALTVIVCAFVIDWRIGLGLAVFAPLLWFAQRWGLAFADEADERAHRVSERINGEMLEFVRCQGVLRSAGRSRDFAQLDRSMTEQSVVAKKLLWRQVVGLAVGSVLVQTAASVAVVLGAQLALGGELRPGLLVGVLALCMRFTQPLSEALEFLSGIRAAIHDLDRIERVLAEPILQVPLHSTSAADGSLELDQVTFGYGHDPVLREVSMRVEPGTMTALVGPSGSGKTTVTKLLARFHDVDAGTVRVGGDDVRDLTTEQLMAQLSLVFQDVYLFDDTLEANVRLGREDASWSEVQEAARLAGVTEIVDRLPDGWNTRVGEAGAALSGGERQRVSIARALLKQAPIVLLDEATAALDPENERHIVEVMERLTATSTVLVIAHRLHTIVDADQIVVLSEDGRVLDAGRHVELAGRCEQYVSFWRERKAAHGWRIPSGAGRSA